MCEIVAPLHRMEFTLWRFYIQMENKSARKCHRREDAHRVVGWECANSGLVERGPWPLVTRQEFLTRGEGGIAYSPRIGLCRKGMEERRQARYQGMPW